MEGWKAWEGGFIRAFLCPALGPGGAGSAQGHYGAAEDESGLLWHRLGHRQEVHLCCLFPPGSQAQGEPVGAWPLSGLIFVPGKVLLFSLCNPADAGLPTSLCGGLIKGTG